MINSVKKPYILILAMVILLACCVFSICAAAGSSAYTLGDVNGDGSVNSADAIQLLRHTLFPTKYEINQISDFNGDGSVNSADAIQLLRHTLFPTKYDLKEMGKFTVTWKNYDGTVLETDSDVLAGTTPTYNGETPTKPSTAQYTYTFSGWSPSVSAVSGNVTYTAQYSSSANKYTVTWKNYDGSVLLKTSVYGDTIPSYDSPAPTKASTIQKEYKFAGWSPAISKATCDTEYIAQFTEKTRQYDVVWKNYDGSILSSTKVNYGELPVYKLSVPTKDNDSKYSYVFKDWNPAVSIVTGDAIYYAQYTQTETTNYTIKYNANEGTGAPSSQTKSKGKNITLSSTVPTNGDHVFMGWKCGYDGKTYQAGSSFSVDANVTLYAIWGHKCEECHGDGKVSTTSKCSNCYGSGKVTTSSKTWINCLSCSGRGSISISYTGLCSSCGGWGGMVLCNCNCGMAWYAHQTGSRACPRCGTTVTGKRITTCTTCSGTGTTKQTQTSKCTACGGSGGKTVTSTSTQTCSSCSGKGTIIKTNTCSACSGNKVIIEKYNSYNITLKDGDSSIGSYTATLNSPYKLTVPAKNGYTFLGWFDANEGGVQYTDGEGVSLSTWKEQSNKTLYAHWSLNYYSITFECDSGIDISDMPHIYSVEDANISLPSPSRTGYTFAWKIGDQSITYINTSLAKDVVVKSVWTPIEYTISYSLDGGTASNKKTYNIETSTFSLTEPTKIGYSFVGWTGSNGNTPQKTVTIEKGTTGDLSFTANWIINQYTISFDSNGGSYVAPIIQDYNSKVVKPDNPSLNNKSFVGWFDNTLTKEYSFGTMPAENITLYAKWIDYDVTLSCGEKKYISINDTIDKQFFEASAVDTDGNSVQITVTVTKGTQSIGGSLTIKVSATGLYGVCKEKIFDLIVLDIDESILELYQNGELIGTQRVYKGKSYTLPKDTDSNVAWYLDSILLTNDDGTSIAVWDKESFGYKITTEYYSISYDANGGIVEKKTQKVNYGASFILETPTRTGYTFAGWYNGGQKYESGKWSQHNDVTLTAKWTANTDTKYVVNHYQQHIDDDEYSLVDTDNLKGTSDSSVTPNVKTYAGFTAPAKQTVTINADGTTVVNYYYEIITATGTTGQCTWTLVGTKLKISGNGAMADNKIDEIVPWGRDITELVIDNGVTRIGLYAFNHCTKIKEIYIPKSVTNVYPESFDMCSGIDTIEVDKDNPVYCCINNCIVNLSDHSIVRGCNSSVIPEDAAISKILCRSFTGCAFKELIIPDNITLVDDIAFWGCEELTTVKLSSGLTKIGRWAFQYCPNLNTVIIPKSIREIGINAFDHCENLERVIYCGTESNWNSISFNSGNDSLKNATRQYHDLLNDFKYDNYSHYSECIYCNTKININCHNYVYDDINQLYECSICHYTTANDEITQVLQEEQEKINKVFSQAKVGSIIEFGSYEQDNNLNNGAEKIEWIVLEKNNNEITLISKYVLDCLKYNETDTSVSWESCTLNSWLNTEFIDNAFDITEKPFIKNEVFLLSKNEASKYTTSILAAKSTKYATARGNWVSSTTPDGCCWWLRQDTVGDTTTCIAVLGVILPNRSVIISNAGVRPCIRISYVN